VSVVLHNTLWYLWFDGEGVEKIYNNYEKTKDNDSSGRRYLGISYGFPAPDST